MNYCVNCNAETKNPKFCSRSCSTSMRNQASKLKHGKYSTLGDCLVCNKIVNKPGAKYCSITCRDIGRPVNSIKRWISGEWNPASEYGVPPVIKKYLIDQAGGKCPECGWAELNQTTGRVPLQIDHIDGNAINNSPENLRVLCPNCHSLTSTFGALNKTSTRKYRYSI